MIWMLVVPILVIIVLHIYFPERMVWWEYILPPAISLVLILALNSTVNYFVCSDTEYHGGWVVRSVWKEHWTETYLDTEIYTDSDGKTQTQVVTRTRYHPDHYSVEDSNNYYVSVDRDHFEMLASKFGNRKVDKPWNSGQSSWGDGRVFTTTYPGNEVTFTPCFTSHRYKNKVAKSHSVFNFKAVSKQDCQTYNLYNYPKIYNYHFQNSLLGWNDVNAEQKLTWANARLGATKQVRIFVLVFQNQPIQAGILQQNFWKNGNKNEVVVCIGVNPTGVAWVYPFAWDNERLLVDLREEIMSNQNTSKSANIDINMISATIVRLVEREFHRKQFKDFEYIQVEVPMWAQTLCFIIVLVTNVGITYMVVTNDIE